MKYMRWAGILFSLILVFAACKFAPFFAADTDVITMTADKTILQPGGEKAVIRFIGFTSTGAPLRDHTRVLLTATLGTIPAYAELVGGVADVEFVSGNVRGEAEINGYSGPVTVGPLKIRIGQADIGELVLQANPSSLDPGGGRSEIRVFTFDSFHNPMSGVPVILTATAGYFEKGSGFRYTDAEGQVTDWLHTTKTSVVKAASGDKSQEITITVASNTKPTASFTFSPTNPKRGEAVFFNASKSSDADGWIVGYEWDFGDGNHGTGQIVSHAFDWTGTDSRTFTVTLTVTDNNGEKSSASQSVTVSV